MASRLHHREQLELDGAAAVRRAHLPELLLQCLDAVAQLLVDELLVVDLGVVQLNLSRGDERRECALTGGPELHGPTWSVLSATGDGCGFELPRLDRLLLLLPTLAPRSAPPPKRLGPRRVTPVLSASPVGVFRFDAP